MSVPDAIPVEDVPTTAVDVLVLGVGNRHRCDDGVGCVVADRLRPMVSPGVKVMESAGDPVDLMDRWRGIARVFVVDAVRSGARPGTVLRFDAHRTALSLDLFPTSTHALGLAGAVELARALDSLPAQLIVFGIEGHEFGHGEALSPEVAAVVDEVVDQLRLEIVSSGDSP